MNCGRLMFVPEVGALRCFMRGWGWSLGLGFRGLSWAGSIGFDRLFWRKLHAAAKGLLARKDSEGLDFRVAFPQNRPEHPHAAAGGENVSFPQVPPLTYERFLLPSHLFAHILAVNPYTLRKQPPQLALDLATRLRALRKDARLTQAQLAERSAVSLASLRRFEASGQISLLSLLKLAHALGRQGDFEQVFATAPDDVAALEDLMSAKIRQRE